MSAIGNSLPHNMPHYSFPILLGPDGRSFPLDKLTRINIFDHRLTHNEQKTTSISRRRHDSMSTATLPSSRDHQPYNYKVVRQFALMAVVWGVVGMATGLLIASQMGLS